MTSNRVMRRDRRVKDPARSKAPWTQMRAASDFSTRCSATARPLTGELATKCSWRDALVGDGTKETLRGMWPSDPSNTAFWHLGWLGDYAPRITRCSPGAGLIWAQRLACR